MHTSKSSWCAFSPLLMCFLFLQTMWAAQARSCGSLRLSEPLPGARETSSSRGSIDIFSGFFTKGEKAVLPKLETFSVLWRLLSLAGKLLLWLVWRVERSTNRSLPERLELETNFLSLPGCMTFLQPPAPPYLLQDIPAQNSRLCLPQSHAAANSGH